MNRHPPGFTLLEVLVAVTVFGLLLAGITQDFHFGLRAWTMQDRIVGSYADLDAVSRTLRGLVQRMDPGSREDAPRVSGSRSRFTFTTELPEAVGGQTRRRADIALLVDERHRLVLRAASHRHAAAGARLDAPLTISLLDGVDAVRFSYLSPLPSGGGDWADSWQQAYLPRLVTVHLDFPKGDARHWPDIVAAPAQGRPRE